MTRFKGLSPVDVDRPGQSPISEGAGSRGLGHVWGLGRAHWSLKQNARGPALRGARASPEP